MRCPPRASLLNVFSRRISDGFTRIAAFEQNFFRHWEATNASWNPDRCSELAFAADTLGSWITRQAYSYEAPSKLPWEGQVLHWKAIIPEQAPQQRRAFLSSGWSYLGANYFTTLDTTNTRVLRAHLESRFGSPSLTLVELGSGRPSQAMQFEYWIVVNDSIRVRVMDPTGPLDRGLILAAKSRYRDMLYNLRQSLLGDIIHRTEPAPYADYYFSAASEYWYLTGFDGTSYFTRRIRAPQLSKGRPETPSH